MARRARRLRSARFLPDETISVDGKSTECYVVHYSDQDLKTTRRDLQEEVTLWIEKLHKVLLKTLSRTDTYPLPSHVPIHDETTVIYSLVELDQQEPASSFTFVAPSDAERIAEFPHPFSKRSHIEAADLAGKSAPELQLKSREGKITRLSSFRGQPVFIEFWATWCGPCVDLMPELTRLYQETANKGLTWISVDSDEDSADAWKFISDEHIPWSNYHDEDGALGKAYQREGIPLGVLIDADGKVVFYQSGYEISDLRAATRETWSAIRFGYRGPCTFKVTK
jgi:thiol-disulfide isomerase/thioredoxin